MTANNQGTPSPDTYEVLACPPQQIMESDLKACLEIVSAGDAVDTGNLGEEIHNATLIAIARKGNAVVGMGAIKQSRPSYSKKVERKSRTTLPPKVLELGYIAVKPSHRRQGISRKIISVLVAAANSTLFATTGDRNIKKYLAEFGFRHDGQEWPRERHKDFILSLWVRESVRP